MAEGSAKASIWLYRAGSLLLMLGLVSGLTTSMASNPRMALSAHLEGVINGILLISLGNAWPHLRLSKALAKVALLSGIIGSLLNWVATELAAVWGTSSFTPIMSGHRTAAAYQETLISVMLIGVAITMLLAMGLIAFGFWRSPEQTPDANETRPRSNEQ